MRTRLLVIVLVLVGLVAVGLGGLLAWTSAQFAQQGFFTRRLTDTVYLASLVERPVTEGEGADLDALLVRYQEVYGVTVHVVTVDGAVFAPSATPAPLDDEGRARLDAALAGRRSEPPPLQMPWDDAPLVIAEPVLVDGEVRGAVVSVSPTRALHERELETWALIAAAVLLALVLGVLVSLPVVRWILGPVRRLDEGTGRVAAAVLAGGAADPVSADSGPPELRRLSASFDRMVETVTGVLAAQRAFVADASHQLRNPLTALRLRLQNLQGHVDAAATDDHIAALEEAERLSTLLDGLLTLARTERAAPLAEVDVDAAVGDRVEAWRPLVEDTGLRLDRDGRRGLAVTSPLGAIETVLDAVLDNAAKFTAPGGAVTVHTAACDGLVEISVRDTGPGLAADELERATDRFWRSPTQSNVEGSGLGLAIAARTVERAGGRLRLESPPDGGLRVVAVLPEASVGDVLRRRERLPGGPRHPHGEVREQPERGEQDRQHQQGSHDQGMHPAGAGVEVHPAADEQVEPDEVGPARHSADRAAEQGGHRGQGRHRHGGQHRAELRQHRRGVHEQRGHDDQGRRDDPPRHRPAGREDHQRPERGGEREAEREE